MKKNNFEVNDFFKLVAALCVVSIPFWGKEDSNERTPANSEVKHSIYKNTLVKSKIKKNVKNKIEPAKYKRFRFSKTIASLERQKLIRNQRTFNDSGIQFETLDPNEAISFKNNNGRAYKRLKDYVAIKKTESNANNFEGATYKLGHYIVSKEFESSSSLVVVENVDTGKLGIFTGVIKIKLKNMQDAINLLEHNNYIIKKSYDHINVVYLKFDDYETTLKSLESIRSHPSVLRANIEVLEFQRSEH